MKHPLPTHLCAPVKPLAPTAGAGGRLARLSAIALLAQLASAQSPTPIEGHVELLPAQPSRASWEAPARRVGPPDLRAEVEGLARVAGEPQASSHLAPSAPTRLAEALPVALWNGGVLWEEVDLRVESRGMPFVWSRTYTSRADFDGELGHNWTHPYARRLVALADGSLARIDGLGREDLFGASAAGSETWLSPPGIFSTLERESATSFVETLPGGLRFVYSSGSGRLAAPGSGGPAQVWRLVRIVDRNGNKMTIERRRDGRIEQIHDTQGRAYQVSWSAGRIASIEDFDGRAVLYTYDAAGDLVSRRSPVVIGTPNGNDFPQGRTRHYTYSQAPAGSALAHNLETIIDPGYYDEAQPGNSKPWLTLHYGSASGSLEFDRVTSGRWGHDAGGPPSLPALSVGGSVLLEYRDDLSQDAFAPANAQRATLETDPAGNLRRHYFDDRGHELRRVELTNRDVRPGEPDHVSDWSYDAEGLIVARTLPRGNRVAFLYDSGSPERRERGNLLELRQSAGALGAAPDLVERFSFEPVFQGLRTSTDARAFPGGAVPLDASGALDLAQPEVARYTTTRLFDYQEGSGFQASQGVAPERRIPEGLGDRNGAADQPVGNLVELAEPTIQTAGPNQGDASVHHFQWNHRGQLLAEIDPLGLVTSFEYYPSNGTPGDASDRAGYLRSETIDALGGAARRTSYEYDQRGNLTALIDPAGERTTSVYNQLDQLVNREWPALESGGRPLCYLKYELSRALQEIDWLHFGPDGQVYPHAHVLSRFEHDILGQLVVREYDSSRNSEATTSWVRYETRYDARGLPLATVLPAPSANSHANRTRTTFLRDERGLLYRLVLADDDLDPNDTPPAGALVRTFNHDANGNLLEEIDNLAQPSAGALSPPSTSFPGSASGDVLQHEYDAFDRRIATTDGEGARRSWEYDAASNVLRSALFGSDGSTPGTGRLLSQLSFEFDEALRPVRERELYLDEDGQPAGVGELLTENEFDLDHRPVASTGPSGHDMQLVWANTCLERLVDALGNEIQFEYDTLGRLVQRTQRELSSELGSVVEERETHFEYDAGGHLIRRTDPAGVREEWLYDSLGNLVESRDGNVGGGQVGNRVRHEYDALGRCVGSERLLTDNGQGDGAVVGRVLTRQVWDADSLLRSRTDGEGRTRSWTYDDAGRVIRRTEADGSALALAYDADGQLVASTDADGSSASYAYDAAGRLVQRSFARGAGVLGTSFERFFRDGAGRLVRAENDDIFGSGPREIAFEYDSLGQLRSETNSGLQVRRAYSSSGELERLVYPGELGGPGSFAWQRSQDALGRTLRVDGALPSMSSPYPLARQRFKGRAYMEQRSLGDDAQPIVRGEWELDLDLRPVEVRQFGGYGASSYQYGYDIDYCQFERRPHDLNLGEVFQHDSLGRLRAEKRGDLSAAVPGHPLDAIGFPDDDSSTWTYDATGGRELTQERAGGQLETTEWQSGALDQYLSRTTAGQAEVFSYDGRGNLVADGQRHYAYDALGRLVEVRELQGTLIARYGYDAIGRRVQVETSAGGGPHVKVFSGQDCIEERDPQGLVLRQYVWDRPQPRAGEVGRHEVGHWLGLSRSHVAGPDPGATPSSLAGADAPAQALPALLFLLDIGTTEPLDAQAIPGMHKVSNVTLKRGLMSSSTNRVPRRFPAASDEPVLLGGLGNDVQLGGRARRAPNNLRQLGLAAHGTLGTSADSLLPGELGNDWIVAGTGRDAQPGASAAARQDSLASDALGGALAPAGQAALGRAGNDILLAGRGNDVPSAAQRPACWSGGLLALRTPNGFFFPRLDGRGNVTGMVDETGQLVDEYHYSAFGESSASTSGASSDNEYRYVSIRRYPATGLYLIDGRDYDPSLGRFLQRGEDDELGNGYSRVGNRPASGR